MTALSPEIWTVTRDDYFANRDFVGSSGLKLFAESLRIDT